jgi:beta-glucoside operon transcriptional antiterminator
LLDAKDDILFKQIANLYPEAMDIAFKVKGYIHQLNEVTIPNEELTYLAVHIHRLISYNQLQE